MEIISRLNSYINLMRFYSGIFPVNVTISELINVCLKKTSSFPVTVDILITDACNLSCDMCYSAGSGKNRVHENADNLSAEVLNQVFQECVPHHSVIHFGGGEPFTREDMPQIIKEVKELDLKCLVTTNGTLLNEKKIQEVMSSGIDGVIVSLYGDKYVHDAITDTRGSFERSKASIDRIKEIKNKKQKIYVSSIMRPENLGSLESLVAMIYGTGVDGFKIEHMNFITEDEFTWFQKNKRSDEISCCIEEKSFSRKGVENMIKVMKRIKRKYGRFVMFKPALSIRDIIRWYTLSGSKEQKCLFRRHSAVINFNGDVIPCQFLPGIVLGNVKSEALKDIWQRTKAIRKKTLQEYSYICQRCCKR